MWFSLRSLPVFTPLIVLAGIGYGLFMGSLFLGAQRVDYGERMREQSLVAKSVEQRLHEIGEALNGYVAWDEAPGNLGHRLDPAWADSNVGRVLTHILKFRTVYLLDALDRPEFAADAQGKVPLTSYEGVARQAASLVAAVRSIEAERPAVAASTSIHRSAVALLAGRPVTLTAALVRSDPGKPGSVHGRAPIVLAVGSAEDEVGRTFAERFLLDQTAIVVGKPGATADRLAQVELAPDTGDGRRITFVWRPKRPGSDLLERSLPYLLLGSLCLLGGAAILMVHAWRTNQGLVRSKEQARQQALHDLLTGLPNRRYFNDRLSQARRSLGRDVANFAVLCLDLDHFKEVNDAYGHEAGDELIREVAKRLLAVCRENEMVVRLGGDEFAVLVADIGAAGAAALAQRLMDKVGGQVRLSRGQVELTCSLGVAYISDMAVDENEILRQADMALYRAKAQGRGRYSFFEPEMDQAIKARKAFEADLRAAVVGDQITTVYQPLVRSDGLIVGVEALARWTHPDRGEVPPSVFIPLAEDCDLIGPIGLKMFRQACIDSHDLGDLRVAVNVSPVQLRRPALIEQFKTVLSETGADPRRINLEITEGCLLRDDLRTHEMLNSLREMGLQLVLDDFGTGYSSLSYLHRYPVEKIKLDRSFIVRLDEGLAARLIVSALIQLAKALKLEVVAEGVETPAQLDALKAMGCEAFQGFLFAKACEKSVLLGMLDRRLGPRGPSKAGGKSSRKLAPRRLSAPVPKEAANLQA